jgi:hypothetical protein
MAHRAACVKVLTCLFLLFFSIQPQNCASRPVHVQFCPSLFLAPVRFGRTSGSKPPYWEWIQGRADWIVGHESHYGKKMRGDDGQSRGYWMISSVSHPEVSDACADHLICSTNWSVKRIRAGHIREWSTFRFCHKR